MLAKMSLYLIDLRTFQDKTEQKRDTYCPWFISTVIRIIINLYKYIRLQKQIAKAHRYLKVTEKQEMNVQNFNFNPSPFNTNHIQKN